ncbi:hypothetical protein DL98DRAFT_533654 [Cadophora sp. DSE1049]|nr:hypothetical protein DL98DRAFT_533654 [Cadophora sp. DSE1049]
MSGLQLTHIDDPARTNAEMLSYIKEMMETMNRLGSYFPPGALYDNPMGLSGINHAPILSAVSTSISTIDATVNPPTASSINASAGATTPSSTPTDTDLGPFEHFTLFPKLVLELRFMVVEAALPEPAILAFNHETLFYKSHKQQKRTVRWIPDLTASFTLADLRQTRALALLRVNKEFRSIYMKKLPNSIKVCQARRERKQSKLYFNDKDLIFLQTFFGNIPLERTFSSIRNTPNPFGQLTRLALDDESLDAMTEPGVLKDFFEVFPALKEIKILSQEIAAKAPYTKYGWGGYNGLNPDPKDTKLDLDENWTNDADELVVLMKAEPSVIAKQASVPKISFI